MNLESLIVENNLLNQEIAILKHELAELRRLIFGAKSERFTPTIPPVNQMSLFDVDQQEPSLAEE
jgi:Transposase C of IS166 homeodomain